MRFCKTTLKGSVTVPAVPVVEKEGGVMEPDGTMVPWLTPATRVEPAVTDTAPKMGEIPLVGAFRMKVSAPAAPPVCSALVLTVAVNVVPAPMVPAVWSNARPLIVNAPPATRTPLLATVPDVLVTVPAPRAMSRPVRVMSPAALSASEPLDQNAELVPDWASVPAVAVRLRPPVLLVAAMVPPLWVTLLAAISVTVPPLRKPPLWIRFRPVVSVAAPLAPINAAAPMVRSPVDASSSVPAAPAAMMLPSTASVPATVSEMLLA